MRDQSRLRPAPGDDIERRRPEEDSREKLQELIVKLRGDVGDGLVLVDDKLGICERLDRDMQASVDAYVDPWTERARPAYTGQFEAPRFIPLPLVTNA